MSDISVLQEVKWLKAAAASPWMWKSSLCHRLNFPVLAVKLTELARRQEFLTKNTEVLAFAIQMKKEEISKYFTTGRRMSVNYSRAALEALIQWWFKSALLNFCSWLFKERGENIQIFLLDSAVPPNKIKIGGWMFPSLLMRGHYLRIPEINYGKHTGGWFPTESTRMKDDEKSFCISCTEHNIS